MDRGTATSAATAGNDVAITLACPHCPSLFGSDGVRPPHCPSCLKAVAYHEWRIAQPPSTKRYELNPNDKRLLKRLMIVAD